MRTRLAFALCLATSPALACPDFAGVPEADLKAALDYYPSITTSKAIAGADCAMEHFRASQQSEAAYRAERGSDTYRYRRMLHEVADLQHRAGKRVKVAGGGQGVTYFRNEIEVRTALLRWCAEDSTACNIYQQTGLLANAYEAAGQGNDLHDWMLDSPPESLAVSAALRVWLKAVYSCPVWDFRPPERDAARDWRKNCTPGCVSIARDAGTVLAEHGARISSLRPQIEALIASVEACGDGEQ